MLSAALTCTAIAAAQDIPLFHRKRNKLDKLVGINKDSALEVYAATSNREIRLDTKVFDANTNGVEMLRFTRNSLPAVQTKNGKSLCKHY